MLRLGKPEGEVVRVGDDRSRSSAVILTRSVVPSACFVSTETVQLAFVISQPTLLSELAVTDGDGHPQLGSIPSANWGRPRRQTTAPHASAASR
jgi:hypothetical protein